MDYHRPLWKSLMSCFRNIIQTNEPVNMHVVEAFLIGSAVFSKQSWSRL